MLIVSAGMQKSGSAYIYNVLNDLLIAGGFPDARAVKARYGLQELMKYHNNNIETLSFRTLMRLWLISLKAGRFAVKTHNPLDRTGKLFNRFGMIKIIYSYRDPRDVLLSAVDHGRRILAAGDHHTFANMVEMDEAVEAVMSWLRVWRQYRQLPGVLMLRYEAFLENPDEAVNAMIDFLDISIASDTRRDILWRYSRDNPKCDRIGLHFNKAEPFRYRTEMSAEQREQCRTAFGTYLVKMGYEVE